MRRAVIVLAFVALTFATQAARAQLNEETQGYLNDMLALQDSLTAENAKDVAKKCVAMGERLKAMQGLSDPQRLGFEAEVERCLYTAMTNGNFKDESGDNCSHHYAFTEKYAASIEGWKNEPGADSDFMAQLAVQLESAMHMGPSLGCKGDYEKFAATLAAAREAGTRKPDEEFRGEILTATSGITKENAATEIEKCNALSAKLSEQNLLFEVERDYYPALIENCLSVAMENGAAADSGGDACAHLYNHAMGMVMTLDAVKREPAPFEKYVDTYREDLKSTIAHAKDLSCKEDFASATEQAAMAN